MYYFALLLTPERQLDADEGARKMQAYQEFHARAAAAIRAGDALAPAAGVRISGGPDHPTVTDGPFAEGAEVAGGYYVFEADNLDEALELARQIPAAGYGAIEVWPIVHWMAPTVPVGSDWMALLLEPADRVNIPDSPEWKASVRPRPAFSFSYCSRLTKLSQCELTRMRIVSARSSKTSSRSLFRPISSRASSSSTVTRP